MAATVFYPHALDFSDGDLITQLTDVAPIYNFQDAVAFSSGDVAPMWSGSLSAAPAITFGSRQIKSILDLCDAAAGHGNGKSYVAYDGSGGSTDIWYRKGEAFGLRIADATAEHERMRMTRAFLRWDSISAQQNQVAEIRSMCGAGYDGSNDPLIDTQQVLSGDEAVNHLFTLGPIDINGTKLDGLQGYTWQNNLVPEIVFDSGVPFPTYLAVATYSPTIVARVRNASLMRTFGGTLPDASQPRGLAITSFAAYLRKLKASDLCEADASEVHVKFSATAGTVKARQVDSAGLVDIFIQLQRPNAASYAFTYDTTAAIT